MKRGDPKVLKLERQLNLVSYLLSARAPVPFSDIRGRVVGYDDDATPDAVEKRFDRDKSDLRDIGDELEIDLAWGRYFRADADEEAKAVELSVKALDGGVATKRMALEKLRAVFDIKDVDAVLEELEEEADEAFARQQEAAAALMRDPGESDNAGKQDGGAAPGGKGSEGPGKARAGQRESADED